jgi:hypothetical protein
MRTTEYTVSLAANAPDFWLLSDRQLAHSCLYIARGRFPGVKPFLRAQAMRVFLLWRDTINSQRQTQADFEQGAGALAALRKRTIQLLVRLSLPDATGARDA